MAKSRISEVYFENSISDANVYYSMATRVFPTTERRTSLVSLKGIVNTFIKAHNGLKKLFSKSLISNRNSTNTLLGASDFEMSLYFLIPFQ